MAQFRTREQASLFPDNDRVLFDGPKGLVTYTPDFIDASGADALFAQLLEQVKWRADRRVMYDRELDVPRLHASCAIAEPRLPAQLRALAARLVATTGTPFTHIGFNHYRDENDSVAPHNDRLGDLVEGHPIVLLSLGATRRMTIRAKLPPRNVVHVDLVAGSLLSMDYATQLHYDHGIPKLATPCGPRISLAFRVRAP
ncbi:MAG: alpha-ketoglutarate-dependent dioxygenase AlkB [Arenimonas sp.]